MWFLIYGLITVYSFACRCSLPPVWRWNQTAADAEWNHKRRHHPCSLRKCLSTAAHHENAGVAQCCHLHQRRKQKCLLRVKWCEVSSLGTLFQAVILGVCSFHFEGLWPPYWMSKVCAQSTFVLILVEKAQSLHLAGLLHTDGTLPLAIQLNTKMWADFFHGDLWMCY